MNQYLITAFDGTNENALDHRMNVRPHHLESIKKMKTPACLADYFVETVKPESTKSDAHNVNNAQPYTVVEKNVESRSINQDASADIAGPNCMCGISTVSKTTLKEGPNKNRTFWVRITNITVLWGG